MVFEDEKTGTELIVLEGAVDVKAIKGEESFIPVDAGYSVRATKDGVISKPEKIDLKKLERWWER
jgi:ferric-dicitrate binding protein FerR (iron transport regulator)